MDPLLQSPTWFRNPVRACMDASAAALFAVGAIVLMARVPGPNAGQLALGVFALGLVALYTVSGLYHGVRWHPDWIDRWQRADHSMIYVVVAATYTPLAVVVLGGALGLWVLAGVWGIAALGVGQKIWWPNLSHGWSIAGQTVLGWFGVLLVGPLIERLPGPAIALGVAGGLFYTIGMVVFVTRRPRLWPPHFSYHELFHVFVVGGSAAHYAVMLGWVAPRIG